VPAREADTRLITRTGVEPVKIITPFLKLVFCAGKLSDVLYRRGRIVRGGGKEKLHWIVLPTKYQVGTDQSQLGY